MQWTLGLLLFLIGPQPAEDDLTPDQTSITILTEFDDDYSTATFVSMQDEVAFILAPAGLAAECRLYRTGQTTGNLARLVVARFSGSCLPDGDKVFLPRRPLGWTHVTNGQISPFVGIDCDQLRDLTSAPLEYLGTARRSRLYGRAMGRVLAHEVFHVVVGTVRHGISGVSKRALSKDDLLADQLNLSEEATGLLKAKVRVTPRGKPQARPTGLARR